MSPRRNEVRRWVEEEKEAEEKQEREAKEQKDVQASTPAAEAPPDHHLVVVRVSDEEMKNVKLREIRPAQAGDQRCPAAG